METSLWMVGVVAAVALVAYVVDRRRGPSESSRPVDFNTTSRSGYGHDGDFNGPMSGGAG